MRKIRVRYAPSPTGLLHIGNARSALFNYLFAKHYNGDFIVRIENTDIKRNVSDGESSQLELLKWLGIEIDESPEVGGKHGPYRQLERLSFYKKYSDDLIRRGLAYQEENGAVRFSVPKNIKIEFDDLVRGKLSFESNEVEDWVIIKENGIPTYNFAVVIDDHLMEITHVLRGEEHITNTPKQIMIYDSFRWEKPKFGHMTIIVNKEKKKLSKRDKDVNQFISEYKEQGFIPQALFNFITLLGWSPPIEEEILSKEQIINFFDGTRLVKSPSTFDTDKMKYINQQYLKKIEPKEFNLIVKKYLDKSILKNITDWWLVEFSKLVKDRIVSFSDIQKLYDTYFPVKFDISQEKNEYLKENNSIIVLKELLGLIESDSKDLSLINEIINEVSKKTSFKGKILFKSIRLATTGEEHGPSLSLLFPLIGKDSLIIRLKKSIERLEN